MTLLLVLVQLAAAAPSSPPAFTPTGAEAAALDAGEIVIRPLPATDGGVKVVGCADVQAPFDAVWDALLDFKARLGNNPSLRSVAEYRPATATEQWWRWEAARFGVTVVYHNHYLVDRARGVLVHELDTAQVNDLQSSRGVYEVGPSPTTPGATRLVYTAETTLGRAVPTFVQSWLAGGGVRDFLEYLVRTAETP